VELPKRCPCRDAIIIIVIIIINGHAI
jgi:hypothetical protein